MTTTLPQKLSSMTSLPCSRPGEAPDVVHSSQAVPKDLLKLKEVSEKLNLSTRRPSVVQWKQVSLAKLKFFFANIVGFVSYETYH